MMGKYRLENISISIIFFIPFYLYVWLLINPVLHYQRQEPVFLIDSRFFAEFLTYPGGLVEYLSAFLSQFYIYPWIGAFIITIVVWLICLATKAMFQSFKGIAKVRFIHIIPLIFLLILHNQYKYPLANSLGLLLSLIFINLYLRTVRRPILLRLVIYLILGIILYYIAAGQLLFFAVMCTVFELSNIWLSLKSIVLSLLFVVFAGVVPRIAWSTLFVVDINVAYFHILPFDLEYSPSISPYLLYLFFPFVAIIALIRLRFFPEQFWIEKVKWPAFFKKIPFIQHGKAILILQIIIMFIAAGFAAFLSYDRNSKSLILVDYYAQHEQWQRVLEVSKQRKSSNVSVVYQTNRALYHQGRLAYNMFSFLQTKGSEGLMLPRQFALSAPLRMSDIYFELGLLNEAQHWAHEALTHKGPTPWNLQRLAMINIIKGNKQFAQNCLTVLKKNLFAKEKAKTLQRYLEDDSLVFRDEKLQRISALMVDSDFVILPENNPVAECMALLSKNRTNKMAFEYLMANYLLTRRLGNLIENIGRLKDFEYPNIPKHYEEALVLYMMQTGRRDIDLAGYTIHPGTLRRFQDFNRILTKYRGNKFAAKDELMRRHGNTYWYYIMLNPVDSGVTNRQP